MDVRIAATNSTVTVTVLGPDGITPISGAAVTLFGSATFIGTTTNGRVTFASLPVGNCTAREAGLTAES